MKVWPRDDNMRKFLFHPVTKIRFPKEGGGPAEWPDDQFTRRRIRDGDVTIEESATSAGESEPHNRRSRHRSPIE